MGPHTVDIQALSRIQFNMCMSYFKCIHIASYQTVRSGCFLCGIIMTFISTWAVISGVSRSPVIHDIDLRMFMCTCISIVSTSSWMQPVHQRGINFINGTTQTRSSPNQIQFNICMSSHYRINETNFKCIHDIYIVLRLFMCTSISGIYGLYKPYMKYNLRSSIRGHSI